MINKGFGTSEENNNFQIHDTVLRIRFPSLIENVEAYLAEVTEGTWDIGTRTLIYTAMFKGEPLLVINYFRSNGNRSEAYVYTREIDTYFHEYAEPLKEFALTEGFSVREGVSNELKLS